MIGSTDSYIVNTGTHLALKRTSLGEELDFKATKTSCATSNFTIRRWPLPAKKFEADLMTAHLNSTGPEGRKSPSFGIGTLLFVVVLAFLIYLLVATMVRHRFFRGGHPHRISTLATRTPISI
jgi:hypothetical protein